jgi:hypothetical protein
MKALPTTEECPSLKTVAAVSDRRARVLKGLRRSAPSGGPGRAPQPQPRTVPTAEHYSSIRSQGSYNSWISSMRP